MAMSGVEVDFHRTSYRAWHMAVNDLLAGRDFDLPSDGTIDSALRNGKEFLERAEIRMLKAFASHLDSLDIVTKSDDIDQVELVDILKEAQSIVEKSGLPQDEFRYISTLVEEARETAVQVNVFGASVYRKITAELGGELLRIVGQTQKPEQRMSLLRLIGRLLSMGAGNFTRKALETAGQEITQDVFNALGPGSGS